MEIQIVEILAGGGIETAFKELGIEAKCTYKSPKTTYYEVWEIAKDDMLLLECTPSWPKKYGWWRYCDGSNMGPVNYDFTIKGQPIIAWLRDGTREDLERDWAHEPKAEKEAYNFDFEEYAKDNIITDYTDLLEYFCDHCGCSVESNVFALAKDLAEANHMSVAQLFTKYQG